LNKVSAATTPRGGPQSVGRILTILEELCGASQGATLTELSESTGAPKTSLVGLLAGLTEEGCLGRDDGGRYFLGARFLSLAMRAVAGRELSALVRPVLVELVSITGETAVLGALSPEADEATYLDKVESDNPIRYAVTVGERRELYCTAVGKVLLAWFDADRLETYLKETPRTRFTDGTITGKRELLAELATIREEGVARSFGERVTGACAIAAPIFAADGTVVATLLVAGPTERMQAKVESHERYLRRAADECTRLAGGVPASHIQANQEI
jgi:IclR family transcriptional regulator, acetate operon repressor